MFSPSSCSVERPAYIECVTGGRRTNVYARSSTVSVVVVGRPSEQTRSVHLPPSLLATLRCHLEVTRLNSTHHTYVERHTHVVLLHSLDLGQGRISDWNHDLPFLLVSIRVRKATSCLANGQLEACRKRAIARAAGEGRQSAEKGVGVSESESSAHRKIGTSRACFLFTG